jgi:hypothetical protein
MGYSQTIPSGYLKVSSRFNTLISLTNVATTFAMNDVQFPEYQGGLALATVDFHVLQFTDGAGAGDNYTNGTSHIQVRKASVGGGYTTALTIPQGMLFIRSSGLETGNVVMTGSVDVTSLCASGDALNVQWYNARALSSTLAVRGASVSVNMYFI